MQKTSARQSAETFQLKEAISLGHRFDREAVLLFGVVESFLEGLFKNFNSTVTKLIIAAPAIAEIEIAADRADIETANTYSKSPFAADIESITNKIETGTEIVYLANPNRKSGASYSNLQIKQLAKSIKRGIIIVDEYYLDFSGLSALALTGILPNLIVLKTFADWQNAGQTECGYAVISEELIGSLGNLFAKNTLNQTAAKKCLEIFENKKSRIERVAAAQKQSLEIATALSNLGLRCQITPADFIIIFSENADDTAKEMRAHDIDLEVVKIPDTGTEFLIYKISSIENSRKLERAFMKTISNSRIKSPKQMVTV